MAADQQLASEVANALTLYYYDNYETAPSGYVTISKSGVTTSNGDMSNAMAAVFGDEWQRDTNLKLKGDWTGATGTSMLNYAIEHAAEAPVVAGSTFLTDATTDGMMQSLTTLTGIATKVINPHKNNAVTILNNMGLTEVAGKLTALEADGLKTTDEGYADAISNLLVGHFSGNMNAENVKTPDTLENLAIMYATFYAYTESIGDTTTMEKVNTKLLETTDIDDLTATKLFTGIYESDADLYTGYMDYMSKKAENDQAAFLSMMGAMNQVSSGFTDKESLTNPNLYSSDSVKNQVNEYVNAVKLVNGMNAEDLAVLKASAGSGNVVVTIAGGIAAVSPAIF